MRETISDISTGRVFDPAPSPRLRREKRLSPEDFSRWVETHHQDVVDRWLTEVLNRSDEVDAERRALMREFLELLMTLLQFSFGPYREQVELLWRQTAELYGNVGAIRGLAAGEVIEEFQFLREVLIRYLYTSPPGEGRIRVTLREILRLNRFLDRGVTHASVGHTDSLFFAHFQGTGVPESLTPSLLSEVRSQLEAVRAEFEALRRRAAI